MKALGLVLLLLLVAPQVTHAQAKRAAAATTPDAVVRELYRVHKKGYGHVFVKEGRKLQQRFFDENLANLIWKDLTETPPDIVGRLDFDPLYNAQDIRITRFRVGAATLEGDRATVPVTFQNYDRKENLKFLMTKTASGWKISNIDYGSGYDLLKILTEPLT
ncbi:MAG TPA: DUF3828 domain-containing protein [Pyrinomonadaceae bacterium]|jgi:hypothetical protein|nr:DUF3828 domain-containing protein [Pyrinomonadaceae bacterium]